MKLFVAAISAIAATCAASQATASDIRVRWSDLDLSSAAGVAALHLRVAQGAKEQCLMAGSRIPNQRCVRSFQKAAVELLPAEARLDYARARGFQPH